MTAFDPRAMAAAIRKNPKLNLDDLHAANGPLEQILWCLSALSEPGDGLFLTARDLHGLLHELEIALSPEQVRNAARRAGPVLRTARRGEEQTYGISHKGRERVQAIQPDGTQRLFHFNANTPYSAKETLVQLAAGLSGDLRAVDRYYGERTLHVIHRFSSRTGRVRVLTQELGGHENAATVHQRAKDLMREKSNVEIRLVPAADKLHDRYIIGDDSLLIVGPGIRDLGTREALVLAIGADVAAELIAELQRSFEGRWQASVPIP